MTDKTELKRLADAANAVMGDVRVDVAITSESGPNQDEIDSVTAFLKLATPAAVLALFAENERFLKLLERMVEQYVPLTELEGVPGWSRVVELVEVVEQRDQLKAEVERLKTENQSEVGACLLSVAENKKLQTENEALRKDAERYRHLRECNSGSLCITKLTIDDGDHVLVEVEADQAIDAATGKGEQS